MNAINLTVVIPVYRDVETLPLICDAFEKAAPADLAYEILFINDGNFANAPHAMMQELSRRPRVRVIHLARNYGQHVAIAAGLKNSLGDYSLVMDSDLQYSPAECLQMYFSAVKQRHSVVLSILPERKGSAFKKLTAKCFYKVMTFLGTPVRRDDLGSVFLVNRHVAQGLALMSDRYRVTMTMALWLSQNVAYYPLSHRDREHGKSGYTLTKLIVHGLNGVTSFSSKPLYLSLFFSMVFAASALGWIIYLLVQVLIFGQHYYPGWTSLAILMLICSAVTLGSLAIVGVYLGRIFETVKGRPLYFVQESDTPVKLFEDHE